MCPGTCPHSPGIFKGHLGLLPLLHPHIKLVSKFSGFSFFSIAVAASWPRSLSLGASLDAGWLCAHKAWQAAPRPAYCLRLCWLWVCFLPLCGSGLPPYQLPSHVLQLSCTLGQLLAWPPRPSVLRLSLPPLPPPSPFLRFQLTSCP